MPRAESRGAAPPIGKLLFSIPLSRTKQSPKRNSKRHPNANPDRNVIEKQAEAGPKRNAHANPNPHKRPGAILIIIRHNMIMLQCFV